VRDYGFGTSDPSLRTFHTPKIKFSRVFLSSRANGTPDAIRCFFKPAERKRSAASTQLASQHPAVKEATAMRLLAFSVFALAVLSTSVCVAPARSDELGPKFEARIRKALEDKDRAELRSLAAEFRKLSAQARRGMPLRVRDDSVEFTFRGQFAGDKFRPAMLEYLVSGSASWKNRCASSRSCRAVRWSSGS
jgi:hypothetical protein